MELLAYKCMECGHFTISSSRWIRCAKCNGPVKPVGEATYKETGKHRFTVNVSIKDTDIFERMVRVFRALMDDKYTPEWIKEKIRRHVLNELED